MCIRISAGESHILPLPLREGVGEGWHQHKSRSRHTWQA
jgi:hypothetical protein